MRFRFRTIYAKNKRDFLRKAEIEEEIYLNEIAISVINNLSVNVNNNSNIQNNNNYNDDYDNLKYNSNYKLILINDKLNSKKNYHFRKKFKKHNHKRLIFRKSSQNSILTSTSSL
jgi:hypothetical protein